MSSFNGKLSCFRWGVTLEIYPTHSVITCGNKEKLPHTKIHVILWLTLGKKHNKSPSCIEQKDINSMPRIHSVLSLTAWIIMTHTISWWKLLDARQSTRRWREVKCQPSGRLLLLLLLGNSGCSITWQNKWDLCETFWEGESNAREGGVDSWPARTPTLPGCTAPVVEVDYAPSLLWTAHAHPPPSLTPCPRLTPLQEAWSASASHFWTASLTTSPWSAWHLINVKHPLLQNPVTSLMPSIWQVAGEQLW